MVIINPSKYAASSESLALFVDNICQCICYWYMQSKYHDTWLSLLTTTVMGSYFHLFLCLVKEVFQLKNIRPAIELWLTSSGASKSSQSDELSPHKKFATVGVLLLLLLLLSVKQLMQYFCNFLPVIVAYCC